MGRKPKAGYEHDRDLLPEQTPGGDSLKVLAVCCFLVLAVLIVFGPSIQHEFIVCDDNYYIYENPNVVGGLTWENVKWSFTSFVTGNWHPLTWLSHLLDVQCYGVRTGREAWAGPEAGLHHLTNILLHAAAAVALFLALRRMTGALWCSAFVAAMFALHPLRAESVAWAAERKDVLSGLFWMLTLLAYSGYAMRPSVGRYLGVVVLFALGLMAKSMLVTLPCVLLLLDFWPLGRWRPKSIGATTVEQATPRFATRSLKWLVVEKLPLLLLSAGDCVVTVISQQGAGSMNMADRVPMVDRIANAAVSAVAYLWSMIWPVNLAIFYPHPSVLGGDAATRLVWQGIAAGALLAVITALVLWNLRRRPYLAVGWFWYLGSLLPVIGLVQVGTQARADRYTYLPMIGVGVMLVWGAAELASRSPRLRTTFSVAAGCVLTAWATLASVQVSTWQDSVTVFDHAIAATSDNYFAHSHRGYLYELSGDMKAALREYDEALRIAPRYEGVNTNLGAYYAGIGRFDKAIECFQKSVNINSDSATFRANLAKAYALAERPSDAAAEYREAIRIDPEYPQHHRDLAVVYLHQGDVRSGIVELREAIRLDPEYVDAIKTLAWRLATDDDAAMRNGREALELAKRAVQLTNGKEPVALNAMAAAYAETGDFDKAEETANAAMRLAVQQRNRDLVDLLGYTIRRYQARSPFRQTRGVKGVSRP
jgi:protein O-mannosyl-transferase